MRCGAGVADEPQYRGPCPLTEPLKVGARCRAAIFMSWLAWMPYRSWAQNWPKTPGRQAANRRGMKPAVVAVARRLAGVLHRVWSDGTEFQLSTPARIAAAA